LSGERAAARLRWLGLGAPWLALGAMFAALVVSVHHSGAGAALAIALRMIAAAALLHLLVERLVRRLPWPHPFRFAFFAVHVVAALVYGALFVTLNSVLESLAHQQLRIVIGPGLVPFLVSGMWLYTVSAGVAYSRQATARAALAEAAAARAQLAALRAQLQPHFLFNALHTVVQLIPREPARAVAAAEQLAELLRGSLEEDRDLVTLQEEWSFVERYLELEAIRLGDRLRLRVDLAPDARAALLPSFALQTLVENAIRHGAAPRVEPTALSIVATRSDGALAVIVADDGMGADPNAARATGGSGLARLRERLAVLTGGGGRLELAGAPGRGFRATLVVPQEEP